jgi:hypothetical protein
MGALSDILEYEHKLISANVPENQARVQAEQFAKIIDSNLVTKDDLRNSMSELKIDMLKWVFGIIIAQTGIFAAIVKFMH